MAARKLKQVESQVNQTTATAGASSAPAGQANLVALSAAVWEAIGKISEKESRRDDIPDGFSGHIELSIAAKIQNQIYRQQFEADLTVGFAQETAASHTPGGDKRLLAFVLGKLNAATREAILRDIPDDYAASKELPAVDDGIMTAVDGMLSKLRANAKQQKRGAVSVKHKSAALPLALVG